MKERDQSVTMVVDQKTGIIKFHPDHPFKTHGSKGRRPTESTERQPQLLGEIHRQPVFHEDIRCSSAASSSASAAKLSFRPIGGYASHGRNMLGQRVMRAHL